MKDLGKTQRDYAIYLPAISSFYVKQLYTLAEQGGRTPEGFELGNQGLDFLKSEDSYYHFPYGLYSAGHAQLDLSKKGKEPMIDDRDRANTVIVGDSGGFQVATGVIKMEWDTAKNPGDPAREKLCQTILDWEEDQCDWAMTLDVPSVACIPPMNKRTGLTDFQDAVDITLLNLDYYMKHRTPGKCKFMNILSGNDEASSDHWYESVKMYSDPAWIGEKYGNPDLALEGFAFAGNNKSTMYLALKRILDLRKDGLLEGKGWIHFLGTGKLNWACYLTSIQRVLREHDSPNICLSFDAASPFVNTAYGSTYTYNYFSPKRFGYFMDKAIDSQALKGSNLPMPFTSPIMDRLTAGDICAMAEGDLDKNGKAKDADSTSWDTNSYLYYMAHSVYNHITAVQEANRLADIERFRGNIHYTDYVNDKKTKNTNEFSPYVPYHVEMIDSFVREVLDPKCPNPYELIDRYRYTLLDDVSFGQGNMDNHASTRVRFFDEPEEFEEAEQTREDLMNHEIMTGDFNG